MTSEFDFDDERARFVENALLRMDEYTGVNSQLDFVLRLDIQDVGSWILKFKQSGLILNSRDLIFSDGLNIDSKVYFKSYSNFVGMINGTENHKDIDDNQLVKQEGSKEALECFWSRISSPSSTVSIKSPSRSPSTDQNASPLSNPIKSGWLLKKRDIITAWRCRYFTVYPGRLEYFIGPQHSMARGTVQLFGAEVTGPRRVSVNGAPDHYCFLVSPRQKEKSFRLASESMGEAGLADTTSWMQAFQLAARTSDNLSFLGSPQGSVPNGLGVMTSPQHSNPNINSGNKLTSSVRNIFEHTKNFVVNKTSRDGGNNMFGSGSGSGSGSTHFGSPGSRFASGKGGRKVAHSIYEDDENGESYDVDSSSNLSKLTPSIPFSNQLHNSSRGVAIQDINSNNSGNNNMNNQNSHLLGFSPARGDAASTSSSQSRNQLIRQSSSRRSSVFENIQELLQEQHKSPWVLTSVGILVVSIGYSTSGLLGAFVWMVLLFVVYYSNNAKSFTVRNSAVLDEE